MEVSTYYTNGLKLVSRKRIKEHAAMREPVGMEQSHKRAPSVCGPLIEIINENGRSFDVVEAELSAFFPFLPRLPFP